MTMKIKSDTANVYKKSFTKMMNLQVWVLASYVSSLILFLNQSSTLIFWCLLEINMLMILGTFLFFNKKEQPSIKSESCLFYFMIQSVGSFLILISIQESDSMSVLACGATLMLAMVMKMGLAPLQFWLVKISRSLGSTELTILMTAQKIPLMMVIYSMYSEGIIYLSVFCLMMGSLLLAYSKTMSEMLIYSSIYTFMWMFFVYAGSTYWFLMFYSIYSTHLYYCMKNESFSLNLMMVGSFMFFMGLPPFSLFFVKLGVMEWTVKNLSSTEMIFLWVFTFLALFGYVKYFVKKLTWKKEKNKYFEPFYFFNILAVLMALC